MCDLHGYEKTMKGQMMQKNFGGGIPLSEEYTINPLVYLCVSIKFIETWLNVLEIVFAWRCCDYQYKMKEL